MLRSTCRVLSIKLVSPVIQNCTHVLQELEEMYSTLTKMTCSNQVSGICVDIDIILFVILFLLSSVGGGKVAKC